MSFISTNYKLVCSILHVTIGIQRLQLSHFRTIIKSSFSQKLFALVVNTRGNAIGNGEHVSVETPAAELDLKVKFSMIADSIIG